MPWKYPPVYKDMNGAKKKVAVLKVEESRPELSKTRELENEEEIQDSDSKLEEISLEPAYKCLLADS